MDATMKNPQFQDIYFPNKRKQQENLIVQQNTDTGFGEMNCYDVAHGITITYEKETSNYHRNYSNSNIRSACGSSTTFSP